MDVVDAAETVIDHLPAPIAVVSDNGPCFRGQTFQTAFDSNDPLLRHVRAPESNPPKPTAPSKASSAPSNTSTSSADTSPTATPLTWKFTISASSTTPSAPTNPSTIGLLTGLPRRPNHPRKPANFVTQDMTTPTRLDLTPEASLSSTGQRSKGDPS